VSDQDNKPWEWGDKGVPHNPINHYPEGTRFLCCGYDGHMNQFSQGNYVRYEDYARLKAEVERLTQLNDTLALRYDATNSMLDGCAKEIEEMEAEVERLTKALEEEAACQVGHQENAILIGRLEAQVERLTKAGDVMAIMLQHDEVSKDWNAAKEGKQP
jgi:hypothetical protein